MSVQEKSIWSSVFVMYISWTFRFQVKTRGKKVRSCRVMHIFTLFCVCILCICLVKFDIDNHLPCLSYLCESCEIIVYLGLLCKRFHYISYSSDILFFFHPFFASKCTDRMLNYLNKFDLVNNCCHYR